MNYTDPSGQFTEDAILNYLYTSNGDVNGNITYIQWREDIEWWHMLSNAREGDLLFTDFYGHSIGVFEFQGWRTNLLSEIQPMNPNERANIDFEGITLESIQKIFSYHRLHNLLGFIRFSEDGKPSFYIREGYSMQQAYYSDGNKTRVNVLSGRGVTIISYLCGFGPEPDIILGIGSGFVMDKWLTDILDMEKGDVTVTIGPARFTFQYDYIYQEWSMESTEKKIIDYFD